MPRRSSRNQNVQDGNDTNNRNNKTITRQSESNPGSTELGSESEERKRRTDGCASLANVKCEETRSNTEVDSAQLIALSKPKRRRKKEFIINEEEEALPTYTRKTDRGGYSHTNLSKSRISKANSGNKPWNFGKRRSSADKAKIAAGVRARNRTILLQKLKRLGMTEEEYNIKKKEIKYLRERIRRAKVANGKHTDKAMEQKLQEAIDATNDKKVKPVVNKYC